MEDFISALKSNDLVKAKKAFGAIMLEQTADLISQRKVEIARSIMIEGEEEKEDEEKKARKSDSDDADEGDTDNDKEDEDSEEDSDD